jgi:nucleotide-binding universal stress UspA family protein
MKLQTILVPLDGSPLAEIALSRASELASEAGARLVLLRAVEASPMLGTDRIEAEVKLVQEAEEYLRAASARVIAMGARDVSASVWYGSAPWAISEAARVHHADLICMTTHGRSGLGRLILGSVAETVLRATTTPILLLRDSGAPVEAKPGGVAAPAPAGAATRGRSR